MTQHLSPEADSKVLEIGTGSGYQTAFLAEFAREVYTVERIEELSRQARSRLRELGYENVFYKVDDGSSGWQERAPFDRIIVTAAAGTMPVELIDQLDVNGRMIVPVGPPSVQDLLLITKDEKGNVGERVLAQVRLSRWLGTMVGDRPIVNMRFTIGYPGLIIQLNAPRPDLENVKCPERIEFRCRLHPV